MPAAAEITQTGGNVYYGGHVVVIEQNAATGENVTESTNVLSLTQTDTTGDDARNYVGRISQTNDGDGTIAGNANSLTVTQTVNGRWGVTNRAYLAGNQARRLVQDGTANTATLTQTGLDNIVRVLSQSGTGNAADVEFDGNFNGASVNPANSNFYHYAIGTSHIVGFAAGAAFDVGVEQGKIRQSGTNSLTLDVMGDLNRFGTDQDGQNYLTATITGDSNQIGALQDGDFNSAVAYVTGDGNDVGLRQVGDFNAIFGNASGGDGRVWIDQAGNANWTGFAQAGDGNSFDVDIAGNWNVINADQDSTGGAGNVIDASVTGSFNRLNMYQTPNADSAGANTMDVTITGNNNNNFPWAPSLQFAAASGEALTAVRDLGVSFHQGDLIQTGSDNSLTVSVSTNRNAFATYQDGSGNEISHTVDGAGMNRAVIAQIGAGNTSTTVQNGGFNVVGIVQN